MFLERLIVASERKLQFHFGGLIEDTCWISQTPLVLSNDLASSKKNCSLGAIKLCIVLVLVHVHECISWMSVCHRGMHMHVNEAETGLQSVAVHKLAAVYEAGLSLRDQLHCTTLRGLWVT